MAGGGPRSIGEALEWLRKHFDADAATGVRASYEFDLAGPGGGAFHARIDDGSLELGVGRLAACDVRFRLAAGDLFAILAGRENADLLFMANRLSVEGDLSLALKVRALFHPER